LDKAALYLWVIFPPGETWGYSHFQGCFDWIFSETLVFIKCNYSALKGRFIKAQGCALFTQP